MDLAQRQEEEKRPDTSQEQPTLVQLPVFAEIKQVIRILLNSVGARQGQGLFSFAATM